MRLTALEKRVLRVISDAYPIPFEPSSRNDYAVEERSSLLTADEIHANTIANSDETRRTIEKLCEFQLVHPLYLLGPGEYADCTITRGHTIRHLPLPTSPGQKPTGRDVFQITKRGQDEIDTFVIERVKRMGWKAFEERGAVVMRPFFLGWVGRSWVGSSRGIESCAYGGACSPETIRWSCKR